MAGGAQLDLRSKLEALLATGETNDFRLHRAVYDILFPPSDDPYDLTRPLEELIRPPNHPNTRYTPAFVGTLLDQLKAGMPQTHACAYVGLDRGTFYDWMNDPTKEVFRLLVENARSMAVSHHLLNIQEHAKTQWTASAWTLERTDPENFGQRQVIQQQVTGPGGGPIRHTHESLENAGEKVKDFRRQLMEQQREEEQRLLTVDGEVVHAENEPWRP